MAMAVATRAFVCFVKVTTHGAPVSIGREEHMRLNTHGIS